MRMHIRAFYRGSPPVSKPSPRVLLSHYFLPEISGVQTSAGELQP